MGDRDCYFLVVEVVCRILVLIGFGDLRGDWFRVGGVEGFV